MCGSLKNTVFLANCQDLGRKLHMFLQPHDIQKYELINSTRTQEYIYFLHATFLNYRVQVTDFYNCRINEENHRVLTPFGENWLIFREIPLARVHNYTPCCITNTCPPMSFVLDKK